MINSEAKPVEEKTSRKYWGLFAVVSLLIFIILILYVLPFASNYLPEDVPVTRGTSGGLNINISERPWLLNFWFTISGYFLYLGLIPFLLGIAALSQEGFLNNKLLGVGTILGLAVFYLYLFPPLPFF